MYANASVFINYIISIWVSRFRARPIIWHLGSGFGFSTHIKAWVFLTYKKVLIYVSVVVGNHLSRPDPNPTHEIGIWMLILTLKFSPRLENMVIFHLIILKIFKNGLNI